MTSPAGCLSLAQEYLRATLAASSNWQAAVGAQDADGALGRIYHEGLPAPSDRKAYTLQELMGLRPYAVVWTAEESGFTRSYESSDSFDDSGQLRIRIERNSPDNLNDEPTSDANVQFRNLIGQIIDDLCDLRGGAGYLAFLTITLQEWHRSDPVDAETWGVTQGALILVEW